MKDSIEVFKWVKGLDKVGLDKVMSVKIGVRTRSYVYINC